MIFRNDTSDTDFGFYFHAIPQMDGKLTNVSEGLLICAAMIDTKDLRRRVFHQVN